MKLISKMFEQNHTWLAPYEERYHRLNRYILLFSLSGHILFMPVFFLLNKGLPFYVNIICAFIDIICLFLNSRWKLKTVYVLFITEISFQTFISNIAFGWDAGFIFYFFAITFYIFLFRLNKALRITMFFIPVILFILEYFLLKLFPAEYPASIIPVWLIYFFNTTECFIIIAFTIAQFSIFAETAENTILKAKEKAEEGERAKSVFLANMSHEIRSPLNSIIGMINLSILSDNNTEKKRYLDIAKNSADHLLTVINDILDYSKIGENRMSLKIEAFNLHHLIKNTMMSMDSSIYSKNLSMKCEVSDTVPENVKGDPSRMRQILINLISNAIKFTEKGSITVRCRNISDDGNICIIEFSVEDTGPGIPEDKIDAIFKRFTQIDTPETKKYPGTGLGLAISKELVELMGGIIRVESSPGNGSIFTFQIPLQRTEGNREIQNLPDAASLEIRESLNVLIAEDIFTNWLLYEKYMQILGHSFKIVENGNMVLEELRCNCYNLVLMDIEMPEMNGEETLKRIRGGVSGENNDIPVIAMTGHAENDFIRNDCRFNGFLIKPIELDTLERMINEVMLAARAGIETQ